jgi:L-fucose isomerase-like protein
VGYDEAALTGKFGQNVVYANLVDIVHVAQSLADDAPRVRDVLSELQSRYATITVSDRYLHQAAKLEVALSAFWNENRLSGMAMQCWPSIQRLMDISVCATFGRLTEKGMLTACEADLLGVISMLVNYKAALETTVPHFVDWTIQHRDDPNRLLAWHCGNAPACLARAANKVALRSRGDMLGTGEVMEDDPQAGLAQFQLKPGRVTFCRLAEYDGDWRMLIASGEIVPSEETLAGTWSWVTVRDHDALYRTLVEQGFIHHASMIHGNQVASLVQACKFLGIRAVVVE